MKTLLIILVIAIFAYAVWSCLEDIRDILSKNKDESDKKNKEPKDTVDSDDVSIVKSEEKEPQEDVAISDMKVKEVVEVVVNALYSVLSKRVALKTETRVHKANAVLSSIISVIGLSTVVSSNSLFESSFVLLIAGIVIYMLSESKDIDEDKDEDVIFSVSSADDK